MKKIISISLIVFLWIGIISCFQGSIAKEVVLGDLNNDGNRTVQDVDLFKLYLTDQLVFTEEQRQVADINQDGKVTITDYALLKSIILGYAEPPIIKNKIYDVELEKFNIRNDGIVWENNARGMTDAIQYAKENDYEEVSFPLGTYVIKAGNPIMLEVKDLIINFNGATIKMQDEPYSSHWHMIELREPAEDLIIKNGMIQGNRFSEQFDNNNPYNEGTVPFAIKSGNRITIQDITVKDSPGYGMTIETGMSRTKKIEIWASDFELGSISNTGEEEDSQDTMRSKKMYPVGELGKEFEIGYTAGYQGYGSILNQEYKAYFYDENKEFITMSVRKQFIKSSLPENCKYIRLVISQSQIKDGSEGSAFITNAKTFRNSSIQNCTFDANAAVGIAIGGGQNFIIENSIFTRNGINIDERPGISAKVAIDIEDGWECMQNITLRKNTFENNRYDFTSCAGSNLVVEENKFTKGCSIYPRSTNYQIINNTFQGPVEYGVSMGGTVQNNTYTDSSIHTYYKRFGNDTQTYLLDMANETFVNTSIYAQNIDTKKENQVVKNSTFTTTDNKKVWIKGTFEGCRFHQADIFNSAILKDCEIKDTNLSAQGHSQYQNCKLENGKMINNSAEKISILNSTLTNVPIEVTTWATAVTVDITNSTLINTNPEKSILRLSAGKAKEIVLINNIISSTNNVIEFFDTTYSSPQGKLILLDNEMTVPEERYAVSGKKITSGDYQIECRRNRLMSGQLLNPIYQNSNYLKVIIEE